MNIVYASNDSYVRHLGTSMCSLFDANRGCPRIAVYVLSLGLSADNQNRLEEIAARYGRELVFVEMGGYRGIRYQHYEPAFYGGDASGLCEEGSVSGL